MRSTGCSRRETKCWCFYPVQQTRCRLNGRIPTPSRRSYPTHPTKSGFARQKQDQVTASYEDIQGMEDANCKGTIIVQEDVGREADIVTATHREQGSPTICLTLTSSEERVAAREGPARPSVTCQARCQQQSMLFTSVTPYHLDWHLIESRKHGKNKPGRQAR